MQKLFQSALAIVAMLSLSACYETDQVFTLNPDGSGKVEIDATFQTGMVNLMQTGQSKDDQAKNAVSQILEQSEGIDVWKDVSFEALSDGRVAFQGTAYFRNVANLKFNTMGNHQLALEETDDGFLRFTMNMGDEKSPPSAAREETLSDEEIEEQMTMIRGQFQQQIRPMMTAFVSGMEDRLTFHLPGDVKRVTNMQTTEEGALHLVFNGEAMLEAMDVLLQDEEWLKTQLAAGGDFMKDGPASSDELNEKMFGTAGPMEAVMSGPLTPQFDYAAGVEVARAQHADMMTELGLRVAPSPSAPKDTDVSLADVRVGGVRWVHESSQERGLRPFHQNAGLTLVLIAEFDGPITEVEEGRFLTAIADNGDNLLPSREFERRLQFPRLSKDETAAMFEMKMDVPGDDVTGLREVSGTLQYMVAGTIKEVDLGIEILETGVKGTQYDVKLEKVERSAEGGSIQLRMNMPKSEFKEITVYNEHGQALDRPNRSTMWSGSSAQLTLSFSDPLPEQGRIVVDVYDEQKRHDVPFKLENISLLGRQQ